VVVEAALLTESNRPEPDREVVAAIGGHRSERARALAERTRRVVLASRGVLFERKAGHRRVSALALAAAIAILLALAPLVWWAVDTMVAGEHLGEMTGQIALWACMLCAALVAATLVAGWMRGRS